MVAMDVSMRGQTGLYTVPSNVKINEKVFIDRVLKPLFKIGVPSLYPGEERKVTLHGRDQRSLLKPVLKWLKEN